MNIEVIMIINFCHLIMRRKNNLIYSNGCSTTDRNMQYMLYEYTDKTWSNPRISCYPEQHICDCINISYNFEEKEEINVKNLYRIFVVTTKEEIIIKGMLIISENAEEAIFKMGLHQILKERYLELKDVSILFETLGRVKVEHEEDG